MRTQLKFSISVLFLIMMKIHYVQSQSYCDSNPVDIHGNLSVSGNRIVDQNNTAVSFAGNSLFWSNTTWGGEKFYNSDVVSTLKNDWNTTIVRAAMGVEDYGGYLSDTTNKDRVTTVVDAAISEGLYVIIDWHSHNAESYQQDAIDFFKEMAIKYGDYPNVIYEIYNEPIYSSWSNDIKPYAEAVISEIRAIDSDNLIIVGTPTWSQDVDVASADPITTSTNIAYTLHFYAGTHGASYRAKAQTALDNGVALMVTEWGTVDASGDGSVNSTATDEWMDFLSENHISHLNWSVNDKSEGASILNSGASQYGGWSDSDLTASGLKVKSIIASWAQYCDGEPIEETPIEYVTIPAKIEAEDYVSASGIQTEISSDTDGGENVGYIDTDDFLTYNVNVTTAGEYAINFRLASSTNGSSFDIYSENTLISSISSNATGGWQTWETVSTTVSLPEGEQSIKILATGTGWNINWLEFSDDIDSEEEIEEEEEEEENNETLNCNDIATWSSTAVYSEAGTRVVYDNNIYENKWYTVNQDPVENSVNSWDLWTLLGSCDTTTLTSITSKASIAEDSIELVDTIEVYQESTTVLTINVENVSDYSKLLIFNIQGRLVHSQNLLNNTSNISIGNFKSGVFFLKFSGLKSKTKSFYIKK
ncbi:cellulase family glycosylhydrolase [Cellulophaga baltica]|uniref:cellulase family glycosylhydrolase n=1 Tax=Cellulophaga TaxID=104264 RepID=UPI001C06F66A|nr:MULTISPECIES: cellulase family glycosylhydrolase [Cellulophaga]MBU2996313.1 cellulase family glycosylhydrolase [Cellulophaga baltica]MDO6767708.1 cellulase family glycosylhydrolase [Cellulophaga sp. 1_MG-2023]